ncbi:MBG domain-containing protein, partial [Flavobacterium sp. FlaQc-51]|uniref:MBG domain-containing protein n=1 Tax=Flavobacterium sp. FlaQc-51 TaxID=3374184 RepID=UPI003758229E
SLTTPPTIATIADATSPVGTYPITASGAVNSNYTIAYVDGTLTVTAATLTITADAQTKTYGSANPTLTASYTGFVNGDTVASLTTPPTIITIADATSPVGTYPITASGAVNPNYTIAYVDGTLTVTAATLTITADAQTKTYGSANPTLTASYTGFVNGDTATSLTTPPTIATIADATSPVGTYPITASGAVNSNYTIAYVDGTLTVTSAILTITADAQTKTYGDANPTLTATYTGFVNGDTAASLTTPATIATTAVLGSPVGTYPIKASGAVNPNYTIAYVDGTLTVTAASLTITADDKNKVYGDPNPTLTVSYTGFANGDTEASLLTPPTINTTATTVSSVGTYPIVASGASDPNYTINYIDGTLTISATTLLTIVANNQSKIYGEANPTLTISYIGFVNGDTEASLTTLPTISTTAIQSSPVGTYPITASGAVSANYTIAYTDGTLTVNPATLTVSADAQTKTYGSANPTLTATYTGFVNGDTVASLTTPATISTIADATSPVGTYPIRASGAVSANYTIAYTDGILTVNPATLTVTADAQTKIYGDSNPTLTASYSGFVNGDTVASLTTPATITTIADATSPVGTYPITASGAVNANYTIAYVDGTLTVTVATLTITADAQTKAYGSVNPTLTASYTGFVNGDTAATLTTAATITTTADATSPVGTYPITASGALNPNYTIAYVDGTLTVTAATLTITADAQSKIYGDSNPTLTASYSGFVNGDTATSLTTPPTIATIADATSPVGTYTITASGAVNPNYTIAYVDGILTVTAATLTITADSQTKTYGSANPTLTASYSGFVNGDTATSLTTPPTITTIADATSPVGTYTITASGAVNTNYTIAYVDGILTVTAAILTVTADDQSKDFGEAIPTLTASYTGFVNGDTVANLTTLATVTTTANAASLVGTYPITASGALALNYTFNYVDGILTVTPLTDATLSDLTISEGTLTPAFATGTTNYTANVANDITSITVTPFTNDADAAVTINGITVISGNASGVIALAVGSNVITTVVTAQDGITTETYTIVVNRTAPPTIVVTGTLAALTTTYGTVSTSDIFNVSGTDMLAGILVTAPSGFEVSSDGIIFSNSLTVGGTGTIVSTPVYIRLNGTIAAGNYSGDVLLTSTSATTMTLPIANSTVNPAALTITANDATRLYGAADPVFSSSATGFVNGDTNAIIVTPSTITSTATIVSAIGNYELIPSGAVLTSSNYIITYVSGNLAINAATLTITANNQTKTYGSANPALTASYTGFVNGDTVASLTTAPTISTTAVLASAVGTYPITANGAASSNYAITYVNGNLAVTTAPLTITADDKSRVYGAANPTLTASYSGFVNGDTSASLTTPPVLATIANATSPVGVYAITVNGAVDPNYSITYITGTLTVLSPTDVNLASLTISNGVLTPAFSPNVLLYNTNVSSNVNSEIITIAADDPLAKITINGVAIVSGGSYTINSLQPGVNAFVIKVTSEDGLTTKSYILNITKEGDDNASLSNLKISNGILDPKFNTDITNYNTVVKYDVASITVTPTVTDPGAKITVNGLPVTSNTASTPIILNFGDNTIETVVTAEDGVTKETYTIIVYKGLSPDALVINNILSPNGDGKNDFWVIKDIDQFPNNKVTVYDRAGRIVYTKNSYSNEWDGTYSGSPLNNDTYYYLIDLGDGIPRVKGFITMIRD